MDASYRFFANTECRYYPCHQGAEEFNCLFCFCPLYGRTDCPGKPSYIERGDRKIKDCSACNFPHRPESYDVIMELLREKSTRQK